MGAMNGHQILEAAAPPPPRRIRLRRYVPGFPRRREIYTEHTKELALKMLRLHIPCREVAARVGPYCSSATPIRWRQQAQRLKEYNKFVKAEEKALRRSSK